MSRPSPQLALPVFGALAAVTVVAWLLLRPSPDPIAPAPEFAATDTETAQLVPPPLGVCGDGVLDPGEQCEPGDPPLACGALLANGGDSVAPCSESCVWELEACDALRGVCGDGLVTAGEQCDDGNRESGDGCSRACRVEGDDGREEAPSDSEWLSASIAHAWRSSPCADTATRTSGGERPPVVVRYALHICELPVGDPVFPLGRVREAMRAASRYFRRAGIELVEDSATVSPFDSDCVVPFGAASLRRPAAAVRAHGVLPLYFVRSISGSSPGSGWLGYASFGWGAVFATPRTRTLVHELGHAFGLLHTHHCAASATGNAPCTQTGDGICDTPFDPGPDWLGIRCAGSSQRDCVDRPGSACDDEASPDRANAMSYYADAGLVLSSEQLDLMRCLLDHELAWLTPDGACRPEGCNGRDDDCDGGIDEGGVCAAECLPFSELRTGRNEGVTEGHGDMFAEASGIGGGPDRLYRFAPERLGSYCIVSDPHPESEVSVLSWREGCRWDSAERGSNADEGAASMPRDQRLEVVAGPDQPAWIGVSGWRDNDGIAFRLDVEYGGCEGADGAPIRAPQLRSPAHRERVRERPVPFRWAPVAGADAYEIRLSGERAGLDSSRCDDCTAHLVEGPGVDLTALAAGTRVYWTVRAWYGDVAGPFAEPRYLVAGVDRDEPLPPAPDLVEPSDGAVLDTLDVDVSWEPVADAVSYEARLALDPAQLTLPECTECAVLRELANTFTLARVSLAPDIDYYWTVRTMGVSGWGDWAPTRRFSIERNECTYVGRTPNWSVDSRLVATDVFADGLGCGDATGPVQGWLLFPERSGRMCVRLGADFDGILLARSDCEEPETQSECVATDRYGLAALEVEATAESGVFVFVQSWAPLTAEDIGYTLTTSRGRCY